MSSISSRQINSMYLKKNNCQKLGQNKYFNKYLPIFFGVFLRGGGGGGRRREEGVGRMMNICILCKSLSILYLKYIRRRKGNIIIHFLFFNQILHIIQNNNNNKRRRRRRKQRYVPSFYFIWNEATINVGKSTSFSHYIKCTL